MSKKFLLIFLLIFMLCGCKTEKTFKDGFAIVYKDNIPYLLNKNNDLYELSEYDYLSSTFGEYMVISIIQVMKLSNHNTNKLILLLKVKL